MVNSKQTWRNWHVSLDESTMTMREAEASLKALGAEAREIPLMVQLVENPRYDIPGFDIFHGAVDLQTHDRTHILLGRGLLPEDEAFVIGFTMGSTNRVSTTEEVLYSLISKYLYPKFYKFPPDAIEIFRDATKLGYISDCQRLDVADLDALMDYTPAEARRRLGIEDDLLRAYYAIEAARYPEGVASQRLLPFRG